MLWKAKLIIVAAALKCTGLLALPAVAASLGPANLRVEYLYQPLGVDLLGPRFFWQDVSKRQDARQTAHQLQVRQRGQDLWDSGKVLDPGPLLQEIHARQANQGCGRSQSPDTRSPPNRDHNSERITMHRSIKVFFLLILATASQAALGADELASTVTEVASGVFRLRAGEPEKIVPSLVRMPENTGALKAMPRVTVPPLLPETIHVVRMARGCRIELPLRNDEVIYGLGLQCKHLEQNGCRRTLYTASGDDDGGGMGHAPVPFYVSTAGYGVLVDSARYLTFSVGEKQRLADVGRRWQARAETRRSSRMWPPCMGRKSATRTSVYVDVPAAPGVDLYLFAGPRMGEAIVRYNLFSGGGCLPPLAGLGPEYLIGAMLDARTVLATCQGFKHDRMPVTSVGLEPCWQTHAYSSSYRWNREKFPEGFVESVRRHGLRTDALVPTLH